jgi:hypothetical protein
MRPDDILQLLRQRPFQPFRIHLSNGALYEVRHPELALVSRSTMYIFKPAADLPYPGVENYDLIALVHINHVEPLPTSSPAISN